MTNPWTRGLAPRLATGFVRVNPLPPDPLDPARELDFIFPLFHDYAAFTISDTTGMVIITDASGLTMGTP